MNDLALERRKASGMLIARSLGSRESRLIDGRASCSLDTSPYTWGVSGSAPDHSLKHLLKDMNLRRNLGDQNEHV